MSDYTPSPNMALLPTLAGLAGHHGKPYCYPSQTKIIELHARQTGESMSVATLNRHLRALELDGWITRTCRHRADGDRGWTFRSTLYQFTRRAWRWIAGLGARIARWAAGGRQRGPQGPSLNFERQSDPSGQSHAPVGPAGPPGATTERALAALAAIKATFRR